MGDPKHFPKGSAKEPTSGTAKEDPKHFSKKSVKSKNSAKGDLSSGIAREERILPSVRDEIGLFLKKVKFRRRIFGGVDEKSVWKKIEELNALYTKALEAERTRYDVLIAEAKKDAPPAAGDPGPETGGGRIGEENS